MYNINFRECNIEVNTNAHQQADTILTKIISVC